MRHLNLDLEKLEQRIAPSVPPVSVGIGVSASGGSKSGGSKSNGSKGYGSKSGGSKSGGSKGSKSGSKHSS